MDYAIELIKTNSVAFCDLRLRKSSWRPPILRLKGFCRLLNFQQRQVSMHDLHNAVAGWPGFPAPRPLYFAFDEVRENVPRDLQEWLPAPKPRSQLRRVALVGCEHYGPDFLKIDHVYARAGLRMGMILAPLRSASRWLAQARIIFRRSGRCSA